MSIFLTQVDYNNLEVLQIKATQILIILETIVLKAKTNKINKSHLAKNQKVQRTLSTFNQKYQTGEMNLKS